MTDRELLALAAKAAGIGGCWRRGYHPYGDEWYEGIDTGGRVLWNPLTDDGDALRLAVKLRMLVDVPSLTQSAQRIEVVASKVGSIYEPYGDNLGAATRRAIVRAAAEIGRSM
ncbi:hypothetical protein C7416_104427 [Cupriavidus phytorum]|uniref:Phage ABA sandwich domain-containing protein n=1 Tax=Cupriavidus phytorum TaxID=3024399 RepID=A0A2W7QUV3_9BURK|nr:hypothetical protein [Cupriavidus alkaliphilus]PZX29422.1 hypothetical protein C7416_104427 [Cupriavidus alkaliphilus]